MVTIQSLPLLEDNYAWLLYDEATRHAAIVDPSEAAPVLEALTKLDLTLQSILITHHHPDHTGGVAEIVKHHQSKLNRAVSVYCSRYDADNRRVPCVTHPKSDGDTVSVIGMTLHCIDVPGHTLGAIAYYSESEKCVFTGDTLFTAGCGRLFEGTPLQMQHSLGRLADLPPDTRVYCGHEYTEKNLRFAAELEPEHKGIQQRLAQVTQLRQHHQPTVPALMSEERVTNPFLRSYDESLQKALNIFEPLALFKELRERRNKF